MKKITDVDMIIECKKFSTALNRFFKKHPELEFDWREAFEWMFENGIDFYADTKLADGTFNDMWGFALHLDVYDWGFYLAVIEREAD